MTVGMVTNGGHDMRALVEWKTIFQSHYAPDEIEDDQQKGLRRTALIALGAKDPGDGFEEYRAAAISLQWRSTPTTRLVHFTKFIDEMEAIPEIMLRGAAYTAGQRFWPAFIETWPRLKGIRKLVHDPEMIDGTAVYDLVVEIHRAVPLTDGELTQPTVDHVQTIIREHLAALELPPRVTDNRERVQKVVKAVSTGVTVDKKAEAEMTAGPAQVVGDHALRQFRQF